MIKETPLVRQYQDIKSQYPDTFLFFRLGDFYELFGDDAIEASKIMEVTLTKRRDMPMCGIPYHAAFTYIKKLLNKSRSVAICEQVEDPSQAKGIVKREVVRVITPGTIIEDDLLKEDCNNFLASVSSLSGKFGLVLADISTGDFMGVEVESLSGLEAELSRLPVSEVVIAEEAQELEQFLKINFASILIANKSAWYFNLNKAQDNIKDYFNVATLKGLELDKYPVVVSACGGLLEYLKDTQKGHKIQLKKFRLYTMDENMVLDRDAQENLELIINLQERNKKNTLFEVLDFTDTSMGKRKLVQYILRPLKDIIQIRERLNGVEELMQNPEILRELSQILNSINDMERIISKVGFGNCNARDLLGLKESLKVIPKLKNVLTGVKSSILKSICGKLTTLDELVEELEKAITESPPLTVREGNIIKKGYDPQLDELIEIASGDKKWISDLEAREKKRLNIPLLKVGYNKVFGYYIEVTRRHNDKVPDEYQRKQTLVNAERYITEELKSREDSILGAEEKKAANEYRIFCNLRDMVSARAKPILDNAELIARIDVLNSFSIASKKYDYIKPQIGDWDEITVKDGRHPVVERSMGVNEFIPNDTLLDKNENQILIITGPNMAGKSTYLKQLAVNIIMAQMGCFVAAREARIGIVDRIFTRIGAGENLAAGESTFMVEMTEVASILNNATSRSLLILDEVGRGTSTFDGISIAWAVIEEISRFGGRTLFATHYFELTEISSYIKKVKNYNFAVREWKDRKKIVFLRKLQEGSADKSYGIHCAELSGVPKKVIARAWEIFKVLEEEELDERGIPKAAPENTMEKQMTFFSGKAVDKYMEKIEKLDLDTISPVELVNKVRSWKEEIKKK